LGSTQETPVLRNFLSALAIIAVATTASAAVNVNTAQQSELQSTRGLDKFKAKRIIEYRNENGPYHSLDDLAKVIGPETVEKVSQQVAFSGDPYVPPPRATGVEKKARKKP
jgi:competence protein ComEA